MGKDPKLNEYIKAFIWGNRVDILCLQETHNNNRQSAIEILLNVVFI